MRIDLAVCLLQSMLKTQLIKLRQVGVVHDEHGDHDQKEQSDKQNGHFHRDRSLLLLLFLFLFRFYVLHHFMPDVPYSCKTGFVVRSSGSGRTR